MNVALPCIAVFGALLFGLGLWISIWRFVRRDYYFGASGPTDFITKLSRAHGNTAEFAPFLAVLMLWLGLHDPPAWAMAAMVGATTSRILMVIGFLTSSTLARISPLKAIGAVGTYGFGAALTAALIV
jgi:uncharacterized protein